MVQIKGRLNKHGEELFTLSQASGILEIDQSCLYQAAKNIECEKISHPRYSKKIKAFPWSMIEEIDEMINQKKWKILSKEERASAIRKIIIRRFAIRNKTPENAHTSKIKNFAKRFFSIVSS